MSERKIQEEIMWQIEGKEHDAYLDPRKFAYRVLTVLGIELSLDNVTTTESYIQETVYWVESIDDDDWANWDSSNDFDPNDDRYSYTELAPPAINLPPSENYEEELLARFPDSDFL